MRKRGQRLADNQVVYQMNVNDSIASFAQTPERSKHCAARTQNDECHGAKGSVAIGANLYKLSIAGEMW